MSDYTNITAANGIVRPIWARLHNNNLSIWTAIIDFPVKVENQNNELPASYSLSQNYPNPFNPSTTIRFTVPGKTDEVSHISLKVYDIMGKEIVVLVNSNFGSGTYEINWNASSVSSGVYFYRITGGNGSFSETKKMILSK